MVNRESFIQTRIKNKLKDAGWMVVKVIQSSLNGFPDQICLKNGRTVFIECKIPGEEPDPLQVYRHQKLRAQGFEVIIATGPDDIKHLL